MAIQKISFYLELLGYEQKSLTTLQPKFNNHKHTQAKCMKMHSQLMFKLIFKTYANSNKRAGALRQQWSLTFMHALTSKRH